ncbi:unnamed protein product [Musa acuminata subsp. burmannicoides]
MILFIKIIYIYTNSRKKDSLDHKLKVTRRSASSREDAINGSGNEGAPWSQSLLRLLPRGDLLGRPPKARTNQRSRGRLLLPRPPVASFLPAHLSAAAAAAPPLEIFHHQESNVRHSPLSALICAHIDPTHGYVYLYAHPTHV